MKTRSKILSIIAIGNYFRLFSIKIYIIHYPALNKTKINCILFFILSPVFSFVFVWITITSLSFVYIFSGKERNLNIVELLCVTCSHWYHESCIGYQLGKLLPFLTNYTFVCKNCSTTGLETFKKSQACKRFCFPEAYSSLF